jgi:HEAT repeat protein
VSDGKSEEELARFEETIRWLQIARKNLAAYPPGHPALTVAFEKANQQLQQFLGAGGQLRISVLRNALLWENEKIASTQAQELAQALYRRDVAILQVDSSIEPRELESLLRVISLDTRRTDETPLSELLASQGVTHAQLGMVNYESIRMTSQVSQDLAADEKTQLGWGTLLGSLRSARGAPGREEAAPDDVSAFEIAALIRRMFEEERARQTETPADPANLFEPAPLSPTVARVTEALSSYASRLRSEEIRTAAQQVARLISLLPEELRHPVLLAAMKAFSSDEQASQELKALDATMAKESALDALMRSSPEPATEPRPAEPAPPPAPPPPAREEPRARIAGIEELKRHLKAILEGEDVDRFNPDLSDVAPDRLAVRLPELSVSEGAAPDLGDRPESLGEEPMLEGVVQSLAEMLDAPPLPGTAPTVLKRLEEAFRYFLSAGLFEHAAQLVDELKGKITDPRVATEVIVPIQESLERLASAETAATILERLEHLGDQSLDRVRQIALSLGAPAIRSFLMALGEEKDNSQRRRILDYLISLGPSIAPEARALLADQRWFVVRNMLYLLRSVGDRTSLPEVRRCVNNPDVRVRLEAIKTIYAFDTNVPRDLIWKTILDLDPKSAETAVMFAGAYGIMEAVDPILSILKKWDPIGLRRSLRLKAIQSLGELGDPSALEPLKRYFKDWFFPVVAREERLAAFRSLEHYPEPARRPFLDMGLKSRVPEIREICRSIAAGKRRSTAVRTIPRGKHG